MDAELMRTRVRAARIGRLATVGADGSPHAVPVCFTLVTGAPAGDRVISAVDHKPKRTTRLRRLANVTATGRACLLVDAYDEDWSRLWWVRLDGAARVVDTLPEAPELVAKYPQYVNRPPAGPYLVLDVARWSGWSAE